MTFRRFFHLLAERIGVHQIPVIEDAHDIHRFLSADGVHHDTITPIVRDIYKKNGCGHLDARIDPEKTKAVIAVARTTVLNQNDTDICRYRFINQLCYYTNEILASGDCEDIKVHASIPLSRNTTP